MKKIFLIILTLFFFVGCSNGQGLKEISFNDFTHMTEDKETFILYIGQTGCTACQSYTPTFKQVLKDYHLKAYYIDLKTLTTDQYTTFNAIINVSGTPTVVFIKNGAETSTLHRINGATSYDKTISKIKNQGYIK
jgi:predicted bacteriocin transport accessory protein